MGQCYELRRNQTAKMNEDCGYSCEAINCEMFCNDPYPPTYQVSWYRDGFWIRPGTRTRDFADLEDAEWFKRYIQVNYNTFAHITEIKRKLL